MPRPGGHVEEESTPPTAGACAPDRRSPARRVAAPAAGRAIGIRPDRISQDELREYHDLKARQDRLGGRDRGATPAPHRPTGRDVPVESGPSPAWVSMYLAQILTPAKLVELLGEAAVEDFKAQVSPTPRTNLHVRLAP